MAVASQVTRANEKGINDNRPVFPASGGLPAYINPFPSEIHPFVKDPFGKNLRQEVDSVLVAAFHEER